MHTDDNDSSQDPHALLREQVKRFLDRPQPASHIPDTGRREMLKKSALLAGVVGVFGGVALRNEYNPSESTLKICKQKGDVTEGIALQLIARDISFHIQRNPHNAEILAQAVVKVLRGGTRQDPPLSDTADPPYVKDCQTLISDCVTATTDDKPIAALADYMQTYVAKLAKTNKTGSEGQDHSISLLLDIVSLADAETFTKRYEGHDLKEAVSIIKQEKIAQIKKTHTEQLAGIMGR